MADPNLAVARQFLTRWAPERVHDPQLVTLTAMAILFGEQRGLEQGHEIANEAFDSLAKRIAS